MRNWGCVEGDEESLVLGDELCSQSVSALSIVAAGLKDFLKKFIYIYISFTSVDGYGVVKY